MWAGPGRLHRLQKEAGTRPVPLAKARAQQSKVFITGSSGEGDRTAGVGEEVLLLAFSVPQSHNKHLTLTVLAETPL